MLLSYSENVKVPFVGCGWHKRYFDHILWKYMDIAICVVVPHLMVERKDKS